MYTTPRRQIIRGASRVAGAVASYAARQAGKYFAAKAANKIKNYGKPKKKSSKKSRGYPDVSTGIYAGKFPRAYSRKYTLWDLCSRYGHTQRLESYGTVSDPDLVGVVHSTFCQNPYARLLAKIVVRALFARVGVNPASIEEPIDPRYNSASVELRYLLNGTMTVSTHTVALNDGIADIAATFFTVFTNALTSGTTHEFATISLYQNASVPLETVYLDTMILTLHSSSYLKLQNRTRGADAAAGVADAERVDNQPIVGYSVKCSGGVPRVRVGNTSTAATRIPIRIGTNGPTDTIAGVDVDINDREPFVKSYFTNGKYQRKLLLQPGMIRSSVIRYKWSGYLNNFFKSIKVTIETNEVTGAPGQSEIFTLEEVLNTGSSNNMVLAVENEFTVGGYLKAGKKKSMRIEQGVLAAL